MITRTFKLCLNAGTGSAPYINVNQYDEGETWLFELYTEQGERYLPTTGAIVGVKSDGHGIANTGTVDSNGRVVINETQQMTASAGRAIFELSIDGLTHGTANFIVAVERKPTDEAVMSDSDLSLIQEAIDSAEVIVEVIGDGDPSEVIGEHVDAWLDNHPEATTTVQDGAITAPKINSTLWDKLLVSEEASGAVASFDDGADDVPVSSLKVALEPIQTGSGDPSPTNIRPIIAANGKNLIGALQSDSQTSYGVTVTPNGDGTFTVNGTNTKGSTNDISIFTETISLPVGNYLFNGGAYGTNGTYNALYLGIRDANNQVRYVGNNGTSDTAFSIAEGDSISNVFIRFGANGTANNLVFKPMIRLASITDSSYQPYQGIMVDVVGKNLLPSADAETKTLNGITVVCNGRGQYLISGTASALAEITFTLNEGMVIPMSIGSGGNGCMYLFNTYATNDVGVLFKNNGTTLDSWSCYQLNRVHSTYPSTMGGKFANQVCIRVVSGATVNMSVSPMFTNDGTTDSAFAEFTEHNAYPYSLGQSVYGGTVDLATGVLTVDKAIVDLGGLTWTYDSTQTCVFTVISDMKVFAYGDSATYVCDSYKTIAPTYSAGDGQNNTIWARVGQTSFRVRDTSYTTATDFKAAVSGHQLVYELATPQTIQLTPQEVKTLLGYNNISSSGTVDVIYHADTKLYVDKMTAVDNAIIAPTEADFVATRNYTVNDLLIVNDTLYKVTANIATGSAITPNSNVTQTTLSALIKALS